MVRNSSVLGVVGDYSQHSTLSPLSKMIKEGKQLLKSAEVYIMAKEISSNVFAKRVLEIPENKVTQNATAYPNGSSYIDLNIALQINRLRIPRDHIFNSFRPWKCREMDARQVNCNRNYVHL